MKVAAITPEARLADPGAAAWATVERQAVGLRPVPLEAQPTSYIREAWKGREYGRTTEASVAAASNGDRLYVRVEWADDPRGHGEFRDAAGAIFPVNGGGALATFGDAQQPLAVWFWEDGRPSGLGLIARGPGVFRKDDSGALEANGVLSGGRWAVVFSGPASAAAKGKLGVAVWNGSNEERAGLAAISADWLGFETA